MEEAQISAKDLFRVNAVGDKLLMPDGTVRYLLFFEADEPYIRFPLQACYGDGSAPWEVFPTRNGFHVIGDYTTSAERKRVFYDDWKAEYPKSDYLLNNWNWLAPHSEAELDYILRVAAPAIPRVVRYYRDKRVFEQFCP